VANALAGSHGAAMQVFRNDVLSAPTSFFDLASLRHAVRLACFAAASPEDGAGAAAGDGFAAAGTPVAATPVAGTPVAGTPVAGTPVAGTTAGALASGAGGAAANPPATGAKQRHTAAATIEKRMVIARRPSAAGRRSMEPRIAFTDNRTDEAHMKLA
jgi:hypothetical protein